MKSIINYWKTSRTHTTTPMFEMRFPQSPISIFRVSQLYTAKRNPIIKQPQHVCHGGVSNVGWVYIGSAICCFILEVQLFTSCFCLISLNGESQRCPLSVPVYMLRSRSVPHTRFEYIYIYICIYINSIPYVLYTSAPAQNVPTNTSPPHTNRSCIKGDAHSSSRRPSHIFSMRTWMCMSFWTIPLRTAEQHLWCICMV